MSYKRYKIELIDRNNEPFTVTVNHLWLLILCYLADGHDAPKIKALLHSEHRYVIEQGTLEGYIQKMKDRFDLMQEGSICHKEILIACAKKHGMIALRNGRHAVIIEETQSQLKLQFEF
jgi:hypothetical protein